MSSHFWSRNILIFLTLIHISCTCFANENLFRQARALQRDGKYNEAIEVFKDYLLQPVDNKGLDDQQLAMYTEALMQLMNTYQSTGEPEKCVSALQEIFNESHIIQQQCLRDYYSVMGYALSRTERMKEAEETIRQVGKLTKR